MGQKRRVPRGWVYGLRLIFVSERTNKRHHHQARTILLFHVISARPSKQPLMVRTFLKVYMELGVCVCVEVGGARGHARACA